MYTIKVDGQTLYDPSSAETCNMVLSPRMELEVNSAGSLSFVLLRGHPLRGSIAKMKSLITVERDGEEVFRGRVTGETIDLFDQAEYHCEGELSFLLDSVQRPAKYNCTAEEFLRTLIDNHNAQVEPFKHFTVGRVTAVSEGDTLEHENSTYHDTSGEIGNELLDRFGGYLHVRTENGVRYLDYLASLPGTSSQTIEFGVNLLDLENSLDAKDIYTVLIPLGRAGLTIADVNNGLDYLENEEAIAQYGRITKTHTWDDISNPTSLMAMGQAKLNNRKIADTLTLTAIDLQLAGVDTDKLWVGHRLHIYSEPHEINIRYKPCMRMTVDMENPENNQYVFGTVPASLADGMNEHTRTLQEHDIRIRETEYGLTIQKDYANEASGQMAQVLLDMDALNAALLLKAEQSEVNALTARVSSAEILIDGANAAITLKASQEEVDILSDGYSFLDNRMSAAEITINGLESEIVLKADKIDLQGYVTVDSLEAETISVVNSSYFDYLRAELISTPSIAATDIVANTVGAYDGIINDLLSVTIDATTVNADVLSAETVWSTAAHIGTLALDGAVVSNAHSEFVTSIDDISVSYETVYFLDANQILQEITVVTDVQVPRYSTGNINYLSIYD